MHEAYRSMDRIEYEYANPEPGHTKSYLWPAVIESVRACLSGGRVFDLGCGNGAFAAELARLGYRVSGVDTSRSGIAVARSAHPDLDLHLGSAYDDLAARFGTFPVVVSLEVIEHLYDPRSFAISLYDLLQPGGTAIVSTPYHGYLKNLILAATGKLDAHFTALWDHGHIKFWSMRTLRKLLRGAGFADVRFRRVGRVPPLAKSMIAIARKPWT